MKKQLMLIVGSLIFVLMEMTTGLASQSMQSLAMSEKAPVSQTIVLNVPGMTCAVCPITVKKALERVAGVTQVTVNFKEKTATVMFAPQKTSEKALIQATTDVGYPSTVKPLEK